MGLWHRDPAAAVYATALRGRGKPGGVIITALARRAAKIAVAMVRDQTLYDPACWPADPQERWPPPPFHRAAAPASLRPWKAGPDVETAMTDRRLGGGHVGASLTPGLPLFPSTPNDAS